MYKTLENPLPPRFGRMYVDKEPPDMGPPRAGDTVTVGVTEEVDFYIQVHSVEGDQLAGEVVAIGPNPRAEYEGWSRGDRIQVTESAVRAIIRDD